MFRLMNWWRNRRPDTPLTRDLRAAIEPYTYQAGRDPWTWVSEDDIRAVAA